jgi:hypothetical protein
LATEGHQRRIARFLSRGERRRQYMAWMLITLSLAGIVYSARIIIDYIDRRDETHAAVDRLEKEQVDIERRQELEVARRDQIREGLPVLQLAVDRLYQRLHELRQVSQTEHDRRKRLEVASYKMQVKMARER